MPGSEPTERDSGTGDGSIGSSQTDPAVRPPPRPAGADSEATEPGPDPAATAVDPDARSEWPGATLPPGTPDPGPVGWLGPAVGGYEILREIGRGGMGVVYLARHCRLNRLCALKMILAGRHADPEANARFLGEAETIARLRHPNIVQIYQIGEMADLPFIELEYVEGGNLADRLDGTPRPPAEAAALVEALADAIHEAHRLGIVHRDLKPANILLAHDGTPRITDFGLAKSLAGDSDLTRTDSVLGSPSYMAPEQAEGRTRQVGPAADVYSLGVILYQLLAGRPPFRGATVLETLEQVRSAEPVPPSRLVPRLPRDLETIVLRCLEKAPARRYETARALAEDLRRWARGEPIRARRSGPVERAVKWARRRPTTAALIGLVVAGTGFGFGTALVQWRRAEAARAEAVGRARAEADARAEAQRALALSERLLYSSSLALAGREWSDAHPGRVRDLLDRCPSALRRWEWSYLDALDRSESLAIREAADVVALAYDRAGDRLATAAGDRVTVRDAATGRALRTLDGHSGGVRHLAFSPDGTRLASGDGAGTVRIWSPATDAAPRVLGGHGGAVLGVAFRPDGRQLAVAVGDALNPDKPGLIKLWEVEAGEAVRTLEGHGGAVTSVAYSPDGRRLASGSEDGTIRLWDVDRAELLRTLTRNPRTPVAGNRLLQVFGLGRLELAVKLHTIGVQAVAFRPDGRQLASACSDMTATLWDPDTGAEVWTFRGHLGPVTALAFRPDGRALATAGDDRIVRLWSVDTGRELASWRGHRDGVLALAFRPGGRQLASADGGPTVRVWDATRPQEYVPLGGPSDSVFGVAFSPDGRLVAGSSGDLFNPRKAGAVTVWDVDSRRVVATPKGHEGGVSRVAFGPDGRLATAGADGTVRVWELGRPGPTLTLCGHTGTVLAVAFSPDGRMIASGSGSLLVPGAPGELKLWDAATGRLLRDLRGPRGAVGSLAFSPDGRRLASGGGDRVVRVWDPDAGREVIGPLEVGQEVFGLAYSPDGRWLAAGAGDTYRPSRPGAVRIWDSASGRGSADLRGHTQQVTGVAFSPDGTRLVSSGRDGLVLVWDPQAAEPVSSLRGSSYLCCVAFSPDGRRIAAGSWDAKVLLWEASAERVVRR